MEQERLHFSKVDAGGGSADEDVQDRGQPIKTKKVVEHAVLFKMKDSLTEEQEKEMLDSLWSLQYQIKNVICTSVGRLMKKTPEGYTHALFSRFPSKEALDEYMESPTRLRVAQDLVIPYYDGLVMVDFVGEVEDDIETVFRRGDDFQEGVEHLMLLKIKENVSSDAVEKLVKTANELPEKHNGLVQLTIGTNISELTKSFFSHGYVARLDSEETYQQYEEFLRNDPSWAEAMELVETSWSASYIVTPVGKTVL